ncbi:MAG: alpha-amylase family glycosyl hydrolase [Isosphaeraceae bacterium]|nr:alpha-amylase family glycosyl hydrolase [Isosphaeraceae bacterium]
MPNSLFAADFQVVYDQAKAQAGRPGGPFASPADWRDQWIYFLMVDRFNNPKPGAKPNVPPYDNASFSGFQGGTFSGVRQQLKYIKGLGAGAIWLSPVLKNFPFRGTYHGYGIHDFLRAEPRYADDPKHADDELRALVDAAHAAGLYVVFDIVLNHTGDAFAYDCDPGDGDCVNSGGAEARYRDHAVDVHWRDPAGNPRGDTQPIESISPKSVDALVWPAQLQQNAFFRRQGGVGAPDTFGDFASLKQMRTDDPVLQGFLIRAYQYVIARYDIDGFRIDTLRYLKGGLARLFGNAIREFALSIGKKNFFTYGEVFDQNAEVDIARFIGRGTQDGDDLVGVDAALDYPLFDALKGTIKGFSAPTAVSGMYHFRKQVEQDILSSHGDATRFFVTFLDNHDVKERLRFEDPASPHKFDDQVTLGLGSLLALPGIPCVYYGTEQALHGRGNDEAVRECLWASPSGFDEHSSFYQQIQAMADVRGSQPALRYGRFYFRPLSGDGVNFGLSSFPHGVLAFSRILNDEEVLVVANTSIDTGLSLDVIVDGSLNAPGAVFRVLYSNKATPAAPAPVAQKTGVTVQEVDGSIGHGPLSTVRVTLAPMEVQYLGR